MIDERKPKTGSKPRSKQPQKNSRPKKQEQKPTRKQGKEVIYTPPKPLNRKKLILRLVTVAAVALALFLGCSIFFRVRNVEVTGTQRYTPWSVREASGIEDGASLLSFGKTKAASRIMENLRYIKSVRIGVSLPDTVNIYVEELDVVYGAQDTEDGWWLIAADGRVVEKTNATTAKETTHLKGFRLANPAAGKPAVAAPTKEPATGDNPVLITDQERLEAALSVLVQLERCEILGEAASVDVTDPSAIQLWYQDDYQVLLGNPERMDEKIRMLSGVIAQHEQSGGYQSGVLDITLTVNPNGVGYTPFG